MKTQEGQAPHEPQSLKKKKKDVVVWQVINDCEKAQMVIPLHHAEPPGQMREPSARPSEPTSTRRFPVEAGERVSLVCRGAILGSSRIVLDVG